MPTHPVQQECERLSALREYDVLNTGPEEPFEQITRIARSVLNVPIVLISLVDSDRQWFKSRWGLDTTETPRSISFCSHAIEESEPLIISDTHDDQRFCQNPLVTGAPFIRSYVGVQLTNRNGYNIGTLCGIDVCPRQPSSEQIAILQDLAQLVIDELELRKLATTDCLTGCLTRRAFIDAAERDVSLALQHRRPLTCIMLDADHFKIINDTYGHSIGDQILRGLVATIRLHSRDSDYIGRLGGEEFAIMLRETSLSSGVAIAERMRGLIEGNVCATRQAMVKITVSAGVAEVNETTGNVESLLRNADTALYSAKNGGRNRIVAFNGSMPRPVELTA